MKKGDEVIWMGSKNSIWAIGDDLKRGELYIVDQTIDEFSIKLVGRMYFHAASEFMLFKRQKEEIEEKIEEKEEFLFPKL